MSSDFVDIRQVSMCNYLLHNARVQCIIKLLIMLILALKVHPLFSTYPLLDACLLTTYTHKHICLLTRVYPASQMLSSPFRYGSLYDYTIYLALLATL